MTAKKKPRGPAHLSYHETVVLQAVAHGHAYGFEIMDRTGLPSGTVYPILRRLESRGQLRSAWEAEDRASRDARPRRRYYETTAGGLAILQPSLDEHLARRRALDALLGDPGSAGEESG